MRDSDFELLLIGGAVLLVCYLFVRPPTAYAYKSARKGKAPGITPAGKGKVTLKGKTKVLKAPRIKLIFWGNWTNANPSMAAIDAQFKALMASNYYAVLTQYGSSKPVYLGSTTNTAKPPNPFDDAAMAKAVNDTIAAGKAVSDPETIYCVLPQSGVKSTDKVGDAWHDQTNGRTLSTYYGKYDLVSIMRAMSEEIGESAVDPWQTGNGDQIGDMCENVFQVNGVTVEGLWSNALGKCTSA